MSGKRPLSTAVAAALTRRELLAATGALGIAAALPLPAAIAAEPHGTARPAPLDDWTIDDMWGVYPRYAEPIGFGRRRDEPLVAASAADAPFVA